MVNVAREAMLSIGCIQAQRCHTGQCPIGVATQNPWLVRGLDPQLTQVRSARQLRHHPPQESVGTESGVRREPPRTDLA
jgi:glutamate synthase domain-containing protein 2